MSDLLKKSKNTIPAIGAVGFVIFIWFYTSDIPQSRPDNLLCTFYAETTTGAPPFGDVKKPIISVRITGHIGDPFEKALYRLAGKAEVELPNQKITAPATGNVFIGEDGQPDSVQLTIEEVRFGADGLNIMTLNDKGGLDSSKSKAYIFADSGPRGPYRLSYPAKMNCSATLKEKAATARMPTKN
jgi:hypothetical protein